MFSRNTILFILALSITTAQQFPFQVRTFYLPNTEITAISEGPQGSLYVGAAKGLFIIRDTAVTRVFDEPIQAIAAPYFIAAGKLYRIVVDKPIPQAWGGPPGPRATPRSPIDIAGLAVIANRPIIATRNAVAGKT